jgi:two-component system, chemotaxis family, sensor kinase CheA
MEVCWSEDPEMLSGWIAESREILNGAEAALLALESDPDDVEQLEIVFRAFHTLKGTSAFMGASVMADLAHRAEDLLARIRSGEVRCEGAIADLALRSADMLRELLHAMERAGAGTEDDPPEGLHELTRALAGPLPVSGSGSVPADNDAGGATRIGDILVARGSVSREVLERVARESGGAPLGIALVRAEAVSVTEVAHALRRQRQASGGSAPTIRVRADRLDRLAELAASLAREHSLLGASTSAEADTESAVRDRIGRLTSELNELARALRLASLEEVFVPLNRLARDAARRSDRQVQLFTTGGSVEVDREAARVLGEALGHMVRNAVGHGIEPSDERVLAGKRPGGRITIAATVADAEVVVRVEDDGRGLDHDAIVRHAERQGLTPGSDVNREDGLLDLLSRPGFSTAPAVTDVAGRGVGMDVVRTNVATLGGTLTVTSVAGTGTTFEIRFPLVDPQSSATDASVTAEACLERP